MLIPLKINSRGKLYVARKISAISWGVKEFVALAIINPRAIKQLTKSSSDEDTNKDK